MILLFPLEIRLRILDFVSPLDLPALSRTCHHLHRLCYKQLKEDKAGFQSIRGRHGTVVPTTIPINFPQNNPHICGGTPELLFKIAQNPRAAWFIKELSTAPPGSQPKEKEKVAVETSLLAIQQQLLERSAILQGEEEEADWMDALAQGRGGAALGLLVCQLPQIKRLDIMVSHEDPVFPYLGRAISRLVARSRKGLRDQGLSMLESAHIEFGAFPPESIDEYDAFSYEDDDSDDNDLSHGNPRPFWDDDHFQQVTRLLATFAKLPRIRNLSLTDYYTQPAGHAGPDAIPVSVKTYWGDDDDPAYPVPYRTGTESSLRSLTIGRGNISSTVLERILEHDPGSQSKLEEFTYLVAHTPEVFGCRWDDAPQQPMTMKAICLCLLQYAKSSLRQLYLEIEEYGGRCGCRQNPCLNPGPFMAMNPHAQRTTNWQWHEFTALQRLALDIDLFSNGSPTILENEHPRRLAPINSGPEGIGWLPFMETLPPSIREVVIITHRCPPDVDKTDFENMLRGFLPQKFPHLRSISSWHRLSRDFEELEEYNGQHLLPVYRYALENAGIPPEEINEYVLDADYFSELDQKHRRGREWRAQMSKPYGIADYQLYALPVDELEGKLVFGTYYTKTCVNDNDDDDDGKWSSSRSRNGMFRDFYHGLVVNKKVYVEC